MVWYKWALSDFTTRLSGSDLNHNRSLKCCQNWGDLSYVRVQYFLDFSAFFAKAHCSFLGKGMNPKKNSFGHILPKLIFTET